MSERPEWRDVLVGIGSAFFMNIAFVLLCVVLISIASSISALSYFLPLFAYGIFGIGLSQLLYIVPTVINLKRQQKWGEMKGVIIGAILTALISGGCFYLIYSFFGQQ
ncbi:hypothetical protein [Kamptonema sp. UHCC 0994]|uniref:hypothetical protein n=1 Tax=Kamptonema sp. UHCC 0994 TaxID=3031329 RepID=UPI0023B991ED|nr:hypothetical protein [Kamptonema sp. UHCC 0994]MDF0554787.1 hypothetical protein [Kamptonema sp. UHCC 0994]